MERCALPRTKQRSMGGKKYKSYGIVESVLYIDSVYRNVISSEYSGRLKSPTSLLCNRGGSETFFTAFGFEKLSALEATPITQDHF